MSSPNEHGRSSGIDQGPCIRMSWQTSETWFSAAQLFHNVAWFTNSMLTAHHLNQGNQSQGSLLGQFYLADETLRDSTDTGSI